MTHRNVDILVDLQFGSTGKGLLSGVLAESGRYDVCVASNMPNAGHTTVKADGRKWVNKALPNGVEVSKTILVGPGAVFKIAQLIKEIEHLDSLGLLDGKQILVHEAAGILKPEHAEAEAATLSRISSTMQGSAEALIAKIRRQEGAILRDNLVEFLNTLGASSISGNVKVGVTGQATYLDIIRSAERVLVEGSQGYSLGISSGFYPYCTSRECTVGRVLADCALPVTKVDKVWGVARVHPIRVGNTADGFSGGHYPDQKELSWEILGQKPELTTVTQRVRRVFSFSFIQLAEAVAANGTTDIFLNFANYDHAEARRIIEYVNFDNPARFGGAKITLVGVGERNDHVVSVEDYLESFTTVG